VIGLDLFAKVSPKAAIKLQEVEAEAPSHLDWTPDPTGFKNCEILYLYGVDHGHVAEKLLPWLSENPDRQLVYLDENLHHIRSFLEQPVAEKLLQHPQVSLYPFEELSPEDPLFAYLAWSFVGKQMTVLCHPSKQDPQVFEELQSLMTFESAQKNEILDEYMKFGIVFYRNYYKNLKLLPKSLDASQFFGQFQGVPAIICGAGPSLQQNLSLLGDLKSKALFFGGGSALNALCNGGVTPHFGVGVDPNPTQYYRMMGHTARSIPFFYRMRMHAQAFESLEGPTLLVGGAGGYDIAEYVEEELGIAPNEVEEGHNVVNLSTSLAYHLGCNPIIFVGMDLGFTDLKAYAEGVVEDPTVSEKEITETGRFETSAILRQDIFGKPLHTQWKWIAESEWTSQFADEHPEVRLLNATEGGLGFEGVENLPLQQVAEEILKEEHAIDPKIASLLNKAAFEDLTDEKVGDLFECLHESLTRAKASLQEMQKENEHIIERVKAGDPPPQLQSGAFVLAESDLSEEPIYSAILDTFNIIYTMKQSRTLEELKLLEDPIERDLRFLEVRGEKLLFLERAVEANLLLLQGE